MTNSRAKLLETKYFLDCMTKNQIECDTFKYNLSAFLAAARSVTLIMQTEFSKVLGFNQWYKNKQTEMENDSTMNIMNNKRRMTIHVTPVIATEHTNINISLQLNIPSPSVSIEVRNSHGNVVEQRESRSEPPPPHSAPKVTTETLWYFEELPNTDVLTLCKKYIDYLDALVSECESRFNTS